LLIIFSLFEEELSLLEEFKDVYGLAALEYEEIVEFKASAEESLDVFVFVLVRARNFEDFEAELRGEEEV